MCTCDTEKCRFLKEQEAKGLLTSLKIYNCILEVMGYIANCFVDKKVIIWG